MYFLYTEIFTREKNKKETLPFKDLLGCVETEIPIKKIYLCNHDINKLQLEHTYHFIMLLIMTKISCLFCLFREKKNQKQRNSIHESNSLVLQKETGAGKHMFLWETAIILTIAQQALKIFLTKSLL